MIYTGEQLVTEIRQVGGIPAREVEGYTSLQLLAHADAYLSSRLGPAVVAGREDYFTQRARIPLVAGISSYRFPTRAAGDKLRAIWYIDAAGNRNPLDPIKPGDLHRYPGMSTTIEGYYLTAAHIVIVGNPGSGSLEVHFPFRVGSIVLSTAARQVSAVNPSTKVITFATAPPSTFAIGVNVDIHSAYGGHDIHVYRNLVTNVGGFTVTVTDPIDGSTFGTFPIEVGDWVCLERQTALVALPEELIPALARGVAKRVAEAENDKDGAEYHGAEAEKDAAAAISIVASDRVHTKPARIKGRSSPYFGGA